MTHGEMLLNPVQNLTTFQDYEGQGDSCIIPIDEIKCVTNLGQWDCTTADGILSGVTESYPLTP